MLTFVVLVLVAGFLLYKSVKHPGMALVGLFCMLTVEQWVQSQSAFFVERSFIINVLFAVVTAFALWVRIYRRELRSEPYPLGAILVLLLFSYALLSTMWTGRDVEIQEIWTMWAPYLIVQILIAPLLVADSRELTRLFAYQIFLGGLFATLITFGSEYDGRQIILGGDKAFQGNPLAVAETGGVTIICAVMMTRLFKGDILFKLIISSICLVAIVKSGSRGQLIALAFALIVAFPFTYSVKSPKIIVGSAIVAMILGYVVLAGLETFWGDSGRYSGEGMSADYLKRIDKIARLFTVWINDPVAIVFGLGNSASFDMTINGSYPHFVPIEILCEEGIVGALVYLWMLVIVLRDALFMLRRRGMEREESAGFAILVAIVVYLFLISLKQGSLIGTSTFFMSVMLFLRAVALLRRKDRVKKPETEPTEPATPSDSYTIYANQLHSPHL